MPLGRVKAAIAPLTTRATASRPTARECLSARAATFISIRPSPQSLPERLGGVLSPRRVEHLPPHCSLMWHVVQAQGPGASFGLSLDGDEHRRLVTFTHDGNGRDKHDIPMFLGLNLHLYRYACWQVRRRRESQPYWHRPCSSFDGGRT